MENIRNRALCITTSLMTFFATASTQAYGDTRGLESICGPNDDTQFINNTNGILGVPFRIILARKGAVGALAMSRVPGLGQKFCTGTMISEDLFLTAAHCTKYMVPGAVVSMNYEYEPGMKKLLQEDFYDIGTIVEDGSTLPKPMDYMILRLHGNPGIKYGFTPLQAYDPPEKSILTIIQHPDGFPKKVHGGSVESTTSKYINYSNLDTQGGSSGSGVLDSSGNLIGVHISGNCSIHSGSNTAVPLTAILKVSPTIQQLLGE